MKNSNELAEKLQEAHNAYECGEFTEKELESICSLYGKELFNPPSGKIKIKAYHTDPAMEVVDGEVRNIHLVKFIKQLQADGYTSIKIGDFD